MPSPTPKPNGFQCVDAPPKRSTMRIRIGDRAIDLVDLMAMSPAEQDAWWLR